MPKPMIMVSFYGNVVAFDQDLKMCSNTPGLILGLQSKGNQLKAAKLIENHQMVYPGAGEILEPVGIVCSNQY